MYVWYWTGSRTTWMSISMDHWTGGYYSSSTTPSQFQLYSLTSPRRSTMSIITFWWIAIAGKQRQRQVWLIPIADWTCWCGGKTVKIPKNTCDTWALLRWWFTERRCIKCTYLYLYLLNDGCARSCVSALTSVVRRAAFVNIVLWYRLHSVFR